MFSQPLINIGMIGHVSDGKSTLTKCLTQVQTQKFAQEKESNITMRLGYANAIIYKCLSCVAPKCYYSYGTSVKDTLCKHCKTHGSIVNHVSFVDCPGHNSFMGTMLNGTSVMDYTITVESAVNKTFPAPQTIQHLSAIESNSIKNIAIILNKIDLVSESTTIAKIIELDEFKQNYKCKKNPVIPMSAAFDVNVDVLCEMLANLKQPERETEPDKLRMNIIRSFNVNLPGTQIENLKGGVIGGSIAKGTLNIGDIVYIYPGIVFESNCEPSYKPIKAKVLTMFSEKTSLNSAICGGLIGIGLDIDPGLTGDDALVGNVIKKVNEGWVTKKISLKINFFDNYDQTSFDESNSKHIILNINTNNIQATISNKNLDNIFEFVLDKAIYIQEEDLITISIKNQEGLQVIGTGLFNKCDEILLKE
jgi:translation initiation factor 2 subunit 3